VPSFVSANAKRGLDLLEFAGDGLRPQTVREARQMVSGDISADKVRRMAAWLARHATDLNSPRADDYLSGKRERPTPGQVAWLLWGGDIGKANRDRAQAWAERKVEQLIREGELDKASAGQIREGVTVQYAVPKPPDPTEYATGIVESVVREGSVTIGGETLEATADDPVARVRVYVKVNDDEYQRTDRLVPRNASQLKVVGSIADKIKKQVPAQVKQTLQTKVDDHNAKYTGAGKRVTLRMLEAVYERGIGAYRTNPGSVRPTVTSAEQWAYGRVNAFLTAVRTGRFPRTAFDTDLLPSGHPLSSKKTTKETPAMDPLIPSNRQPKTLTVKALPDNYRPAVSADVPEGRACGNCVHYKEDRVNEDGLRVWCDLWDDWVRGDHYCNAWEMAETDKGYGYEMKDDDDYGDDYYDPLQSVLDAYGASVRMGSMELAEKIQGLIVKIQAMYPADMGYGMDKGHGNYKNPVVCLTHAYLGLLMWPDAQDIRNEVMAMIHEAEQMFMGGNNENSDQMGMEPSEDSADTVASGYGVPDRIPVQRVVRQEGEQFCVYSEATGRSFGCYATRAEADDRLAQIEQFATAKLVQAEVGELVAWHDKCHAMKVVTPALKLVHDLIEDQLESQGHSRPYDLTPEDKLELLISKSAGLVSKADEQRYTLGPWYVPGVEDAHGEFTDEDTLQKALWDWVRAGDRTIYLQHGEKPAGEMVEIMTVPFPVEAELTVPNQGVSKFAFPANTPFMGVVWEPWAWELVKAGKLRGYSIGGSARRMEAELPDDSVL
jgi:hypothetical protein